MKAIEFLSDPNHPSMDIIASECGICRKTLFNWQKTEAFKCELFLRIRSLIPTEKHASIVRALADKAQDGDMNAIKIYFHWIGQLGNSDSDSNSLNNAPPKVILEIVDAPPRVLKGYE